MEHQKILYVSTFGTLTNNTHKQGGHATKIYLSAAYLPNVHMLALI